MDMDMDIGTRYGYGHCSREGSKPMFFGIRVTYTQVLGWEHTLPCRRACYWYGKSGGHVRVTYTHVLGWEHTLPCHRACYWYGKSDNANEDMGFEPSLLPQCIRFATDSHTLESRASSLVTVLALLQKWGTGNASPQQRWMGGWGRMGPIPDIYWGREGW